MLVWWTLASCVQDGGPTSGELGTLVVDGGFGGGSTPVDGELHVWARVDPRRAIVTGWTGDVDLLETPAEWNSAARVPSGEARVSPIVVEVDAPSEERTYPLPGGARRVRVVVVPEPVGVVLFFHGAAYSVDQLEDNAARTVALHLARAGYTVVAVPSEAEATSGTGGWDATAGPDNRDLATVAALVAALRADGTAPEAAPLFAWGMSSGGTFAHTVGRELPSAAVAAFCAAGLEPVLHETRTPTAWYLAEHDSVAPSAAAEAARFLDDLSARQVPTDLLVHPATPLYDQRFERVTGVDPVRSARIAESLRSAGFADEVGRWTATGAAITAALGSLDGASDLDPATRTAVAAEIEIMAADHELYDDGAARMVAFFDVVRAP